MVTVARTAASIALAAATTMAAAPVAGGQGAAAGPDAVFGAPALVRLPEPVARITPVLNAAGDAAVVGIGVGGPEDIVVARARRGGAWTPVTKLSPADDGTYPPSAVVLPDGTTVVAWTEQPLHSPKVRRFVRVRVARPGQPFGRTRTIGDAQTPTVLLTVVAGGRAALAWVPRTTRHLRVTRLAADGTAAKVQDLSEGGSPAAFGGLADGSAVLVWRTGGREQLTLRLSRIRSSAVARPTTIATGLRSAPRLTVLGGTAVVAYGTSRSPTASTYALMSRQLTPALGPARLVPKTPGSRSDGPPRIALGPAGAGVAVWGEQLGGAEPPDDERVAALDATGNWGPSTLLTRASDPPAAPVDPADKPLVGRGTPAILADGSAIAVWHQNTLSSPTEALIARRPAGAGAFGPAVPLVPSAPVHGTGEDDAVSLASSGDHVVVAWPTTDGRLVLLRRP